GLVAVVVYPEAQIQAVGVDAEVTKDVPEGEGVFAAGDGDQHPLSGPDHPEVVDRPPYLLSTVVEEAVAAEAGIVATNVDHRRRPAPPALHVHPPDTTGRISTSSS